jgi:hemoglobin-like flavoprotein
VNLSPAQKRLVKESFLSIRDYGDTVVVLFYGRLFEIAPQARGLFPTDIRSQAGKLTETLDKLVDALDRFDELRPELRELGRRHAGYHVEPAHYELLVSALTWAFGQALGLEFDAATRKAWQELMRGVSAVMLEGAAG